MPDIAGFKCWRARLCLLAGLVLFIATAHAEAPRVFAPRVFAITDVRIVTAPGKIIESGTIVLRNGFIESVAPDAKAPPDARVIAGQKGWTVYPAFIDAASSVGLDTEPQERPSNGASPEIPRGAPHELAVVHPEHAVVDQLDVGHSSIARHRELGFAVAHVLPGQGVFRGQSATILLRDAAAQQLILVDRFSQVVALETSSFFSRQYPSSSIGAVAAVRQVLLDARRQSIWNDRFAASPTGMPHPEFRSSDAALKQIMARTRPVVFVSLRNLDPGRFNQLANEFSLRGLTVATGLGQRAEDLQAAAMPVLLPLEMPETPALDSAEETRRVTLRQLQATARAPKLPAALAAAGVQFAFVTAGMKSVRNFSENLADVVAAGLTPEQALAAVTTVPASLLGLERTLGTISPGKQANLLIVDGELFTAKPALRHLFVDGYHEEIEADEIIGDPNAVVDPTGTWEVLTEVMGRSSESTWTITGTTGKYAGYSTSDRAGKRNFNSVSLTGNALTVISDSDRGETEVTVVVTGETLAGSTMLESSRGSAKMKIDGRRITAPKSDLQL